jgi:hypothetical protein
LPELLACDIESWDIAVPEPLPAAVLVLLSLPPHPAATSAAAASAATPIRNFI